MQIHELNNFTGTLGSGSFLAVDNGTDTGKLSTQQLLAGTEARIDNIIAGPAPSAEEIVDARLGADGVTYPSLGDAIRDQFTDVKSELTDETNARILLAGRMTTAEGDIDTLETHKVAQPLDGNNQPTNGTNGQSLRTKGDGTTEWADIGLPTDEQTAQAISDWLDDHPEATTTVQDGSLTEAKFTDTLKLKTIKDYVTPQMFGAVGDGVVDDTQALQDCFDYAFDNRLSVYIPSGTYNHTGLVISCAKFGGDQFIPSIFGNNKATTILKHTGSGVNVSLVPKDSGGYIDGVEIRGLHIRGNANTTIGLELHVGTRIQIDDVHITKATDAGIKQTENFWVSSLTNIYIGDCATGLKVSGASVTSIFYNEIYVYAATVEAFHLEGGYSMVGILAADHCTGDYVYNFYYFRGSANSIACEACDTKALFRFNHSNLGVGLVSGWSPVLDGVLETPISCADSNIRIDSIGIGTSSAITSALPLMQLYYTQAIIGALIGNITFAKAENVGGGNTSYVSNSGIKVRTYSNRAYLGSDRSLVNDMFPAPFGKTNMGVAIFTDCTKNPSYLADGTDMRWYTPVKNGDWFIENDPAQYGVAAYVIMQDYTGEAADAKRGVIPVLLANTTANRPTTFPKGGMYFDTTLGKPIFYTGSGWVDATGASV